MDSALLKPKICGILDCPKGSFYSFKPGGSSVCRVVTEAVRQGLLVLVLVHGFIAMCPVHV